MRSDRLRVDERVAVLTEIVRQTGEIGRTSLMKMAYLLQTVKKVPFGYDFELYLYGPYSTQVLDDLSIAVFWGALQEEYYSTRNGYGYRITLGSSAKHLLQSEQTRGSGTESYKEAVRWVVEKFKDYTASEMEAVGTLVWIDRQVRDNRETLSMDKLLDIAVEIKPNFPREKFRQLAEELVVEGILSHVQPLHSI
jgi:uncharacterized protein YwgA